MRVQTAHFPNRLVPLSSGIKTQKGSHAIQLSLKFAVEGTIIWRPRFNIAELRFELTVFHREVAPANHAVAPEQRQSVIAESAFVCRCVRLETVHPAPQQLEAVAVLYHRVEGRQQAYPVLRRTARRLFFGWPIPVDAIDAGI